MLKVNRLKCTVAPTTTTMRSEFSSASTPSMNLSTNRAKSATLAGMRFKVEVRWYFAPSVGIHKMKNVLEKLKYILKLQLIRRRKNVHYVDLFAWCAHISSLSMSE